MKFFVDTAKIEDIKKADERNRFYCGRANQRRG